MRHNRTTVQLAGLPGGMVSLYAWVYAGSAASFGVLTVSCVAVAWLTGVTALEAFYLWVAGLFVIAGLSVAAWVLGIIALAVRGIVRKVRGAS